LNKSSCSAAALGVTESITTNIWSHCPT